MRYRVNAWYTYVTYVDYMNVTRKFNGSRGKYAHIF